MGTSSGAATFNSLLQSRTPEPLRGRAFTSFDMLWQLGRLLSLVLGGALAAAIGIQALYYLGGALLIAAAVIGWAGLRHTRPARIHGRREPHAGLALESIASMSEQLIGGDD